MYVSGCPFSILAVGVRVSAGASLDVPVVFAPRSMELQQTQLCIFMEPLSNQSNNTASNTSNMRCVCVCMFECVSINMFICMRGSVSKAKHTLTGLGQVFMTFIKALDLKRAARQLNFIPALLHTSRPA